MNSGNERRVELGALPLRPVTVPPTLQLPTDVSSAVRLATSSGQEAMKGEENSGETVSSNILPNGERSRNLLPYVLGLKRNNNVIWFSLSCQAFEDWGGGS